MMAIARRPLFARLEAGRAVVAFGALVLVLLWLGIAWDLGRERSRALKDAEADTANLARVFDEHIQRTIAGLDQSLLYLRAEYERNPRRFSLANSVANNIILKRVSVQVAIIGSDGVLADSSVAGFTPIDLSDREHFAVHRTASDDMLFVSKPVLGRASGKWSIQLTRRLNGPGGAFAGVLVISLDPHYLSEFYGSVDLGNHGAVMLVGRDGIVRAASSGAGQGIGESVAPGMVDAIFSNGAGSQRVIGPSDKIQRVASFRPLDNLPLAVWVGRSQAEVLAAHAGVVAGILLVGAVITLVLGAALLSLYALVRRQQDITHDLAVKKSELIASRERLKRYVADLERIAEVAAHDLQEPLRRVVAYAQLLSQHAQNALDAEGRDYIAHVVAGAHRIRKLVQDLEAFVAVDHLPPVDTPVPANYAIAAATERLAGEIREGGVTVLVDALPEVAADEKSLTEIFTQLIDNAVRYRTEERKPLVHVTARREGEMAVFRVRDNGVGIAARDRSRIFEIFRRLHGFDTHPGTGMGLAIVRRMVERLDGRLWVESEPGEGSTFCFTLPLVVSDREVQAA